MQVLSALGDAPTAAIAVVAILLGVFLAARGPRERRAAGGESGEEEAGPMLLKVPVAPAPDREPGFVGPKGEVVGHGPIRLGAGPEHPSPAAEPQAPPAPAPPAEEAPPPAEPKDPAWRVAARAANPAAHFRQGTIKLRDKPADKPKDQ